MTIPLLLSLRWLVSAPAIVPLRTISSMDRLVLSKLPMFLIPLHAVEASSMLFLPLQSSARAVAQCLC